MADEFEYGRTITQAEADFIAYRLTVHARLQRKKVTNAIRKEMNAKLIETLETDIAECGRIAAALQVKQ